MIFQVERIQVSRIQDFESNAPPATSASLKDRIERFNQGTKDDTAILVGVLKNAETYVRESVDSTLKNLQEHEEDQQDED